MALGHNPSIVTSGLVLCLDAANKRSYPGSGTTVSDATSNQPNTIMTNGVTYSSDGYWGFDGTDDYIGQANLSTTLSGGTMELWTYITSINRQQGFFVLNQGSSGSYINFWMPSTNNMRWEVIGTTVNAYSTINATTIATTNTWYQFVGTFNGTNTKIYVNGVEEATQNMSNQPSGAYTPAIQVGRYDATYPAAARISIVRFYNTPLSATQILQNFNATRSRYGI